LIGQNFDWFFLSFFGLGFWLARMKSEIVVAFIRPASARVKDLPRREGVRRAFFSFSALVVKAAYHQRHLITLVAPTLLYYSAPYYLIKMFNKVIR
jgi:hypothetical protein